MPKGRLLAVEGDPNVPVGICLGSVGPRFASGRGIRLTIAGNARDLRRGVARRVRLDVVRRVVRPIGDRAAIGALGLVGAAARRGAVVLLAGHLRQRLTEGVLHVREGDPVLRTARPGEARLDHLHIEL